jgi:hypothetical protein
MFFPMRGTQVVNGSVQYDRTKQIRQKERSNDLQR